MNAKDPLEIVQGWQEAVNRRDVDRLLEHSSPGIVIVGPRGPATGHGILRDWLERAGLSFEPKRTFARENVVVVEQHAVWRSVDSGELIGEADVASRFLVQDGLVTEYARHDDLETALRECDLTLADEIDSRA